MPTLEWDKRKCIKNCQPEFLRATIADNVKIPKLGKEDIIADDIAEAYELLAKVVTTHGEKYLPIFERIYSELQKNEAKDKLMEIAKSISQEELSTDVFL